MANLAMATTDFFLDKSQGSYVFDATINNKVTSFHDNKALFTSLFVYLRTAGGRVASSILSDGGQISSFHWETKVNPSPPLPAGA